MKILFSGDLAMFGKLSSDPDHSIQLGSELKKLIQKSDHFVINLESPYTNSLKKSGYKSAYLKSSSASLSKLKQIGVTHACLANNHILDYGQIGLKDTINNLNALGIEWFGCEGVTSVIGDANNEVELLGYCSYNTNPSFPSSHPHSSVNMGHKSSILKSLQSAKKKGRTPVLSMHSGQEHVPMPSWDDVEFARSLAKDFDYLYVGHHPHVAQGCEQIDKSYIAYSLGNFLFDDVYTELDSAKPLVEMSDENRIGIILEVDFIDGIFNVKRHAVNILNYDKVELVNKNHYLSELDEFFLINDEYRYKKNRTKFIDKYFFSRKSNRNLRWYLRRLRKRYLFIYINALRNKKLYQKYFENS
jgi:gamma-polyglutamate biosynthesis protein CapA